MKRLVTVLYILTFTIFSKSINALTFKSDGSVVQSSGEIVRKSAKDRFSDRFNSRINWPISSSLSPSDKPKPGYFGNGFFLPGTPLLSLHGISKGDNYIEKIAEINGFPSKSSLMRFMLSAATPIFLKQELGLTEAKAIEFAAQLSETDLDYINNSKQFSVEEKMLFSLIREVDKMGIDLKGGAFDDIVSELIGQTVESQLENSVEDSVEQSIDNSVEQSIEESLEKSIESAMEASFNRAIQNIIDSGGTILEAEITEDGWSITHDGGSVQ